MCCNSGEFTPTCCELALKHPRAKCALGIDYPHRKEKCDGYMPIGMASMATVCKKRGNVDSNYDTELVFLDQKKQWWEWMSWRQIVQVRRRW